MVAVALAAGTPCGAMLVVVLACDIVDIDAVPQLGGFGAVGISGRGRLRTGIGGSSAAV
ncbi:hypothetical protein OH799_01325 [Nocardia sp. NBC_00881]|uniref:hypothetical protein n=1 Tax=Nocardia sp. NBC_00881 TaxID=2975995 RepID=UPI00386C5AD8|nr:hypothetical protein OH799_01325 [Nocardia sp. NBC_00881]